MTDAAQTGQSDDRGAESFWKGLVTRDGIFVVDSKQRIRYWSASAQRLLGYRPEDVENSFCYEVIAGHDSRSHRFCRRNCPVMANARHGRPASDYDILCPTPNGEKWLNVSVVIPKTSDDLEVIHIFRDVSSRRSIEEFARKASVAMQALLEEHEAPSPEEQTLSSPPLPTLSKRELEVLRLLSAGLSTRQIAQALDIQPVTARNHINRVLTKLGVGSRLQAVVYASQHRLI